MTMDGYTKKDRKNSVQKNNEYLGNEVLCSILKGFSLIHDILEGIYAIESRRDLREKSLKIF